MLSWQLKQKQKNYELSSYTFWIAVFGKTRLWRFSSIHTHQTLPFEIFSGWQTEDSSQGWNLKLWRSLKKYNKKRNFKGASINGINVFNSQGTFKEDLQFLCVLSSSYYYKSCSAGHIFLFKFFLVLRIKLKHILYKIIYTSPPNKQ